MNEKYIIKGVYTMVYKEAIDAALTAHAQWKKRLQDAIIIGKSEFQADMVKRDDACQFGKWLNEISADVKTSEDFMKIKTLHAEFHKVAGEILGLALSGNKEEALKKLEHGGGYGSTSGKLVIALNNWKSKL